MKTSWGNYPKTFKQAEIAIESRHHSIDFNHCNSYLPYGKGRSYGDSCLNDQGTIIDTTWLNHFIAFDIESGLIRVEAGVTLEDILNVCVKYGWFLPVLPGTKYVTIGGAIANDIHGKNHHSVGAFGCHVTQFELLRSDGKRYICSPQQNQELYQATIGGLGLTGLIIWADIQLKPIHNANLDTESIKFNNLDEFFEINQQSLNGFEYTVAWLDCQATDEHLGRGIYLRANHNVNRDKNITNIPYKSPMNVPINFPNFALNPLSIKLFNHFYYNKQKEKNCSKTQAYETFFFPLDKINGWNKIYGTRGFLQYQFVIEDDPNHNAIKAILELITSSKQSSFLTVLKTFGDIKSPGMLSFPKSGVTLALDFPNNGIKTFALLNQLDEIVLKHNGKVYPAKDARMSAEKFKNYYTNWQSFKEYIDPKFSSNFWRRVHEK